MARLLAIDYGDRWIGLALSDPSGKWAWPLKVVEGETALHEELKALFAREDIGKVVLGLPLHMDGTMSPKARQVLQFKERLEKAFGKTVETWDERLTTFQAEGLLRQGGLSGRERAARMDKVAAQIILQSYLDCQQGSAEGLAAGPSGSEDS